MTATKDSARAGEVTIGSLLEEAAAASRETAAKLLDAEQRRREALRTLDREVKLRSDANAEADKKLREFQELAKVKGTVVCREILLNPYGVPYGTYTWQYDGSYTTPCVAQALADLPMGASVVKMEPEKRCIPMYLSSSMKVRIYYLLK